MTDLLELAARPALPAQTQQQLTRTIYNELLANSRHVDGPQFRQIHPDDLRFLYRAYDRIFFDHAIERSLASTPLTFRLSRRLTKVAGKLTRFRVPNGKFRYELTISATLLFQSFGDTLRPVTVAGLECPDRLEALQRIFEHELLHLYEFVAWGDSRCQQARFQKLSRGFFGHLLSRHDLITQSERARAQHGLHPGCHVTFQFEGQTYRGVLNRITRRATVLVEDPAGRRFSDGKRYLRYYVPLEGLTKTDQPSLSTRT